MAFEIKFSFNGSETVFNNSFIKRSDNIANMQNADFDDLEKSVNTSYAEDKMDLERTLYYLNELQSWNYSTQSDQYVKDYFGESSDISENDHKIHTDKYLRLSRIIGVCGQASADYFEKTAIKAINDIGEKNIDNADEYQGCFSNGHLMPYFWYKHKRHYKDNPISLSVFLYKTGIKKVAIELHDTKANNSHIKELFLNKINNVISIVKDPVKYGFSKGEFDNLLCTAPDDDNLAGDYEGTSVLFVKDIIDDAKYEKGRFQFFVVINESGDFTTINEGLEYLLRLYEKVSHSSIFEREIYKTIHARKMKQMIFNGAPGTGKTYGVKKYVEEETIDDKEHERWKIIQFHPSYDYSDFVEGIRPISVVDASGKKDMSFVKIDGEFKKFCRAVVTDRLDELIKVCTINGIVPTDKADINRAKAFNYLLDILKKQQKGLREEEKKAIDVFNAVDSEYEQLYYFIIDEINRADISKVFGELMYAFEYRGVNNRIPTQYSQLNETYEKNKNDSNYKCLEFDCFEDGFFIPENVVIIGTMNDIDKSVESFDFAMRRRFQWIRVDSKEVMMDVLLGMLCKDDIEREKNRLKIAEIKTAIDRMNEKIVKSGKDYGLTSDYHIGPSYFKNCDITSATALSREFELVVEPTLREYIRGRADESRTKRFINDCFNALMGKDSNENVNNNGYLDSDEDDEF